MRWRFALRLLLAILAGGANVRAQSVEVDDTDQNSRRAEAPSSGETQSGEAETRPTSGKERAGQYFRARQGEPSRRPAAEHGTGLPTPRYLALQIGTFFSDQSYKWGKYDQDNVGQLNAGVTYRLGEWVNSMDLSARIEYTTYELDGDNAQKLSIGPLITFPDANSRFPIYFGGGIGAGLFIKQVNDRSPLGLDWQVVVGARFFDVIQHVGFVIETGLKNHILIGSVGQFNGVFINAGTVFAF